MWAIQQVPGQLKLHNKNLSQKGGGEYIQLLITLFHQIICYLYKSCHEYVSCLFFEMSMAVKSTSLKDKDKEVMEKRESLYLICN